MFHSPTRKKNEIMYSPKRLAKTKGLFLFNTRKRAGLQGSAFRAMVPGRNGGVRQSHVTGESQLKLCIDSEVNVFYQSHENKVFGVLRDIGLL